MNEEENKVALTIGEGMRWIGLKDTMKKGQDRSATTSWILPDGSHPTWLNFNPGEPDNHGEGGPNTGSEPCVAAMGFQDGGGRGGQGEEAPDPREALAGCLKICPDLIFLAESGAWSDEGYWDEELVCSKYSEVRDCAVGDGLETCTEEIVKSYGEDARIFMTGLQDISCGRRLRVKPRSLGGHTAGGWFDVPCQVPLGYFCRMPKSMEEPSQEETSASARVGGYTALLTMLIICLALPMGI
jgi:hypothetical protein